MVSWDFISHSDQFPPSNIPNLTSSLTGRSSSKPRWTASTWSAAARRWHRRTEGSKERWQSCVLSVPRTLPTTITGMESGRARHAIIRLQPTAILPLSLPMATSCHLRDRVHRHQPCLPGLTLGPSPPATRCSAGSHQRPRDVVAHL